LDSNHKGAIAGEKLGFLAALIILLFFILIFTGIGKTLVDYVVNNIKIDVIIKTIFP
jgi:hypothetical protein